MSKINDAHTPISMDVDGVVTNRDGKQVAAMMPGEMRIFGTEIVKAVNSHAALVAAVKDAQNRLRGAGMLGGAEDPMITVLAKMEAV